VCRERDADTQEKTRWWKSAPIDSSYEEEASFPLVDIQAISGDKSGSIITVWTDETKGHDFYIDERNNFEALLNALDNAEHIYLIIEFTPVESTELWRQCGNIVKRIHEMTGTAR